MNNRHEEIVPPPKSSKVADTLSRDGAMALAKRLQQYSHVQEYQVECNLVNGPPPRYRDESK